MAFDAYLQVTNIPGESTDSAHQDWIEILSFSHGLSQPASGSVSSGGSRTAERVNHEEFSIVKALDKASPKLAEACCTGEHLSELLLSLNRAGGDKQEYMQYKLSDVIVSSVRPGGAAEGSEALPLEEVSFRYGKIEWTYTETDKQTGAAKGQVSAGWDLKENKKA